MSQQQCDTAFPDNAAPCEERPLATRLNENN